MPIDPPLLERAEAPKQGGHKGPPYTDGYDGGAPLVGALLPREERDRKRSTGSVDMIRASEAALRRPHDEPSRWRPLNLQFDAIEVR
jgi:hypothetical protein